jgi:hypothetical protein
VLRRPTPCASVGAPTITHAQLVASWRRTLDAFGSALACEERYFPAAELRRLELHLANDRRWLERFGAIRSFP